VGKGYPSPSPERTQERREGNMDLIELCEMTAEEVVTV